MGPNQIIDGEDAGISEEYKIVGSLEADPIRGLISNVSPLGHAIINHKVGDIVEVKRKTVKNTASKSKSIQK